VAKRLRLLHELIPHAVRIAVLVNPGSASITEATIRAVQEAAPAFGMQIQIVKATTVGEIDAAFDEFARDRPDALFVAPDGLFTISRRVQLATLAARERIPTSHAIREPVEVGGLMSYGTDLAETFRLIGSYVGNILKGVKPADLPVLQSTKFELVINLQTARALGIQVPPGIISITDAVIE
jgi:putative ABC transport system substrate-binding protein